MIFKGQTVLITGAAVGIGRAAAMKFAQKGAKVVLVDVNQDKLEITKKELLEYSDDVLAFICDVSDINSVNQVVEQVFEVFGKVDILINNAAIWREWGIFEEAPIEQWNRYFDINVMGTVYFTRAVIGRMKENKFGRIINIASVAGVYGKAKMVEYSATKGAVIAMSKALAKEVASYGITVNSIYPGSVSPSENPDPNFFKESELAFMGRTGTNMENAHLICFIASREADYISGQNIQIDGCRKSME